jgi:hypothetical protein
MRKASRNSGRGSPPGSGSGMPPARPPSTSRPATLSALTMVAILKSAPRRIPNPPKNSTPPTTQAIRPESGTPSCAIRWAMFS